MFCPRCGTSVHGSSFCPACGAAIEVAGPVLLASRGLSRLTVAAVLVAGTLSVVVAVLAGLVLLLEDRREIGPTATIPDPTRPVDPAPSATETETVTATPSPSTGEAAASGDQRTVADRSTSPAAPTTTPSPGLQDVRLQSAGLFCRDLFADGYSYTAAVDYWRFHGQPNQMDADRNGIPCETVYPVDDVSAYWAPRDAPVDATDRGGLASGLFCRDLHALGFSYPEATAYWWADGAPDRMDADLNGIPCETVYPASDVFDFWYG